MCSQSLGRINSFTEKIRAPTLNHCLDIICRQQIEKVVTVTREAETSVLERVHVGVKAYGVVGRGGFGEVAFGVQAVDEGDPFRPGVVDGG